MSLELLYLGLFLAGLWLLYDEFYGGKRISRFAEKLTEGTKINLELKLF